MSSTVSKVIHLSKESAFLLQRLADVRGVSEEMLVAEALDTMLSGTVIDDEISDEELLRRMELETGPQSASFMPSLDASNLRITHAVYVDPDRIRLGQR